MFYNEGYHRVLIIKSINYLRDLTQHRLPFQVQLEEKERKQWKISCGCAFLENVVFSSVRLDNKFIRSLMRNQTL